MNSSKKILDDWDKYFSQLTPKEKKDMLINGLIGVVLPVAFSIIGNLLSQFCLINREANRYLFLSAFIILFGVLSFLVFKIGRFILENLIEYTKVYGSFASLISSAQNESDRAKVRVNRREAVKLFFENKRLYLYVNICALLCCVASIAILYKSIANFQEFIKDYDQYSLEETSNLYSDIRPDSLKFHILVGSIKGKGQVEDKVDLSQELYYRFDKLIRQDALPIKVQIIDNASSEYADSIGRNSKGAYLIYGSFNDDKIRLKIENYSVRERDYGFLIRELGVTDPKLISSLSSLINENLKKNPGKIYDKLLSEPMKEQEIALKITIPKELNCFIFNMIGELMLNDIETQAGNSSGVTKNQQIKYAIKILKLAEKNITYKYRLFHFDPIENANLNTAALYMNLSRLYLHTSHLTRLLQNYSNKIELSESSLIQSKVCIDKSWEYCLKALNSPLTKDFSYASRNFYYMLYAYSVSTAQYAIHILIGTIEIEKSKILIEEMKSNNYTMESSQSEVYERYFLHQKTKEQLEKIFFNSSRWIKINKPFLDVLKYSTIRYKFLDKKMLKVTKRMLDNPNLNSGLEKPIGLKILNLHNEIRIQQSKIAIQFLDNIEKMIDINNYSAKMLISLRKVKNLD